MKAQTDLLNKVSDYYSGKIRAHGATPQGVDWRDEQSQNLRFTRLLDLIDREDDTSAISELGCGYGAFATYLRRNGRPNNYFGSDISADMIEAARLIHGESPQTYFKQGEEPCDADYVFASGIFNVKFDISDDVWLNYINDTIELMFKKSKKGIAFNCLTSYSDFDRKKSNLFYSNPSEMMAWCMDRYGRHVALRQDYGLYEYTIIIRTEPRLN
jgi:SAM-dependent methyltransferase